VISIAALGIIGVCALSGTLFYKNYADPSVLAAMISITSGAVGSLATLLSNMRQPAPDTTTISTPSSADKPPDVTINQQSSSPTPTT